MSSAHVEARTSQDGNIMDVWRIFIKNTRMDSDERLVQLTRELSLVKFDIMCFSETRYKSQDILIDNDYRLIYSKSDDARSAASGVAILVHHRWTETIKQNICSLEWSRDECRLKSHPEDPSYYCSIIILNYVQDSFDDIDHLVMDTYDKRYVIIIRWDFNLRLNRWIRDRILQGLYSEFSIHLANGITLER